jgi:hypothetical protein
MASVGTLTLASLVELAKPPFLPLPTIPSPCQASSSGAQLFSVAVLGLAKNNFISKHGPNAIPRMTLCSGV